MTNLFIPKKHHRSSKSSGIPRKRTQAYQAESLLRPAVDDNPGNLPSPTISSVASLLVEDHSDSSLSEDDTALVIGQREPVLVREVDEGLLIHSSTPALSLGEYALRAARANIDSNGTHHNQTFLLNLLAPIEVFRKCIKAYASTLPLHLLREVLSGQHPQQSAGMLESIETASRYRSDLVRPLLEEQWKALCLREYAVFRREPCFANADDRNSISWRSLYHERRDSEENRIRRVGHSLRETYKTQNLKIHQTQIINAPVAKQRNSNVQRRPIGPSSSLMQRARSEAIQLLKRSTRLKAPSKFS